MRGVGPCGRPSFQMIPIVPHHAFVALQESGYQGTKDAHKGPPFHPSSTRVPTGAGTQVS